MSVFAEVALPLPLSQTFLYVLPDTIASQAEAGCRVTVPFRGKARIGYIVRIRKSVPDLNFDLKPAAGLIDRKPLFRPEYIDFILQLSKSYYSSAGELFHSSLPSSFQVRIKSKVLLTGSGREALRGKKGNSREEKALKLLEKRGYNENYLVKKLGKNGRSVFEALKKKKWIAVESSIETAEDETPPAPRSSFQMEMTFYGQAAAAEAEPVLQAVGRPGFSPFLLRAPILAREDIYFALIRKALSRSQTVLFLQPEIDLSHRFKEKWEKKLGENLTILHSRLSEAEKKKAWMRIDRRQTHVIAGPRSALLTPLPQLDLIIMDEEQDDLYYQPESPVYDARKGAWLRAREEKAVLVYGSESPRVEDMLRAENQGFLIQIQTEPEQPAGEVNIVEHHDDHSLLDEITVKIIRSEMGRRRPVLVFTNRRGYAAFLFCARCRYIPRCDNCDIPLMISRKDGRQVCRYCRCSRPGLHDCPRCGHRMTHRKWGAETVAEELGKRLPGKKVESFFSDKFTKAEDKKKCLERYTHGEIDVLIGTRMLARHIKPYSNHLVVVLFPETFLSLPDFRAGQKTYDYISQLKKLTIDSADSQFVVQTAYPRHHAVAAAAKGDYWSFYREEIKYRRLLGYPPFTILAEVIFQDRSARAAARQARDFSSRAGAGVSGVEVLGPSKAPLPRLRGKHRIQMLLKSRNRSALDKIFSGKLQKTLTRASVRIYE